MPETAYIMEFIRPQREAPPGSGGSAPVGQGYEPCEEPAPTPLSASTIEEAREEAQLHWLAWRSNMADDKRKGYWIVIPEGGIVHMHAEPNGA